MALAPHFIRCQPPSWHQELVQQLYQRGWTADQVLDFTLHNPEDLCVMSPEGIQFAGQAPRQPDLMHPTVSHGQPVQQF